MIVLHIKTIDEIGFCGAEDGCTAWHTEVFPSNLDDFCEECVFIYLRLPPSFLTQVTGLTDSILRAGIRGECWHMGCNGGGLHIWIEPRTWLPWPHWAFRRLFPKIVIGGAL